MALAFALLLAPGGALATGAVPLVIHLRVDGGEIADAGPAQAGGKPAAGSRVEPTDRGEAIRFDGKSGQAVVLARSELVDALASPVTFAAWVKFEAMPAKDRTAFVLAKRSSWWAGAPYGLAVTHDGRVMFEGNTGKQWQHVRSKPGVVKAGRWAHVAFAYDAGGTIAVFADGAVVAQEKAAGWLSVNDEPLRLGHLEYVNNGGVPVHGWVDDVRLYAAALSAEQVAAAAAGELAARPATAADVPPARQYVKAHLTRFDRPRGDTGDYAPTRMAAERRPGPHAADWPRVTLSGRPVFAGGPEDEVFPVLRRGDAARPVFDTSADEAFMPGDHRFRPLAWLWGRRAVYTLDRTVRGANDDTPTAVELMTFPLVIDAGGPGRVRRVAVAHAGAAVYERDEPLDSLTLQLPAGAYEVSVNGSAAVPVTVGLEPPTPGDPRDVMRSVDVTAGGARLRTPTAAESFAWQKQWAADEAAVAALRASRDADPSAAPLLARWAMEGDLRDAGPLAQHGEPRDGATFADGRSGRALRLATGGARGVVLKPALAAARDAVTVTAWVRPDALPADGPQPGQTVAHVVTTRHGWEIGERPFSLGVTTSGGLHAEGSGATGGWSVVEWNAVRAGEWRHVALVYDAADAAGGARLYVDGKRIAAGPAAGPLKTNDQPLRFGGEAAGDFPGGDRANFDGLIDDVAIYAAALTDAQVAADAAAALKAGPLRASLAQLGLRDLPPPLPRAAAPLVGGDLPRSTVATHGVSMSHGMSGGWYYHSEQGPGFPGSLADYADHVASLGYDRVVEHLRPAHADDRKPHTEQWLNELARRGVRGGVYPLGLQDANFAFLFHNLADHRGGATRAAQLVAQRLAAFPNFEGIYFGGDNGAYARFWDWSPPKQRWGEAHAAFMPGAGTTPIGPEVAKRLEYERPASQAAFVDYVRRYDQTWAAYGRLAAAVRDVLPGAVVTTGSFGSSPGVLGEGGWAIGTVPGDRMFDGLPVLFTYDWNETPSDKPLHNVALADRLRSTYPDRPLWMHLDDFGLFLSREARQRKFVLALTRGPASVGTNFLPHAGNAARYKNPTAVADYRDLFAAVHRLGPAYAGTRPIAPLAILYVHEQAVSRGVDNADRGRRGPHEGKTTEALFAAHAAGLPARLVTPTELRRGLGPDVRALWLVGLNRIDDTWAWWDAEPGLADAVRAFAAAGGRVLTDDESVAPDGVTVTPTGAVVASYVDQAGGVHKAPAVANSARLFARNAANVATLRAALAGLPPPVCASDDSRVWAVPHRTGDVTYVTVVNWHAHDGANADATVKPHVAALRWDTDGPIYDVTAGRTVSAAEAARCDLTADAYRVYAVPDREPGAPVATATDAGVRLTVAGGVAGVPLAVEIEPAEAGRGAGGARTIYRASGDVVPAARAFVVRRVTNLLNGQSVTTAASAAPTGGDRRDNPAAFPQFARAAGPVVVALTDAQAADPRWRDVADQIAARLRDAGRHATTGRVAPGDVVRSVQHYATGHRHPRWATADVDLVLLGTPADNVLMLDQARGNLLPATGGGSRVTYSAFAPGRRVLNLIAAEPVDVLPLLERAE